MRCSELALQSITLGRNNNRSSGGSTSSSSKALVLGLHSSNGSSSSGGSLSAQPLFELGMAKEDVKARLAPIPVYTVANPKNEFVLVAGEVSTLSPARPHTRGVTCGLSGPAAVASCLLL
jgi:hypothetical protein